MNRMPGVAGWPRLTDFRFLCFVKIEILQTALGDSRQSALSLFNGGSKVMDLRSFVWVYTSHDSERCFTKGGRHDCQKEVNTKED